jgi:ATP phosphoribosyltransferase regulatory subunit
VLTALLDLHGDVRVLDEAATRLFASRPGIAARIDELRALAEALRQRHPDVGLYVDLGELRGYRYHTGVVFAAYGEGLGEALAQGGRYDNVGARCTAAASGDGVRHGPAPAGRQGGGRDAGHRRDRRPGAG